MALITILLSLLLDRIWESGRRLRTFEFVNDWLRRGLGENHTAGWRCVLVVAAVVLFPALVAHGVGELIDDWLFGLLTWLWSALVLFACIGPLPLDREIDSYLNAAEGDDEEEVRDGARRFAPDAELDDEAACHRAVLRTGLAHVSTHVVSAVFWFILLGPFGAVMYRAVLQLADRNLRDRDLEPSVARKLANLLGALTLFPTRIVLLAYGLAGRFEGTLNHFFGPATSDSESTLFHDNNTVLADAGVRALGLDANEEIDTEHLREARRLAIRALTICLAVVAAMTLAGWFA